MINHSNESLCQPSAFALKSENQTLYKYQSLYMDGYAATMGIRQLREDGKVVPVIALTSRLHAEDKFRGEKYGMKARLQKPVSTRKLIEAVREFIEK